MGNEANYYAGYKWSLDTQEQYRKAVKYFIRFVLYFKLAFMLTNPQLLQHVLLPNYISFLARSSVHSTVRNHLNGVRVFFESRGYPDPLKNCRKITDVQDGIKRKKPGGKKQKMPCTIQMLSIAVSLCNTNTGFGAALAAAITIGFFAFLRKANLVPKTLSCEATGDEDKALEAHNVYVDKKSGLLWIRLTHTKTIQFGEREVIVPIAAMPNRNYDPVKLWMNHCKINRVGQQPKGSPAFSYPDEAGNTRALTYVAVAGLLKAAATKLGLNPSKFSSHSLRRGGATFAAISKVPASIIKAIGDWRSNAYEEYIKLAMNVREQGARAMAACAQRG
jgi:hypothetical protein